MSAVELSAEQEQIADAVVEWYRKARRDRHLRDRAPGFTVGGLAGTGKTTIANALPERLGVERKRVAYAAFTGKAASRLADGQTIHRLIYKPYEVHCTLCPRHDDRDERCHKASPLTPGDKACTECEITPKWERVPVLPYDLVIVDEASMVNGWIFKDLSSFGVPVVWIGDHGQLPPVKGSFNLMQRPDVRLETIHRQQADSPILRLAMQARRNGRLSFGRYGPGVSRRRADGNWTTALQAELVLCGRNDTRVALNRAARAVRGFPLEEPVPGDRLICLRNDYDAKVFNGTQGTAVTVQDGGDVWQLTVEVDGGDEVEVDALKAQFGQLTTERFAPRGVGLWDYGYALTVHKAQGSEAERVVLLEQPVADPRRWLYTGITRAKRELEIIAK